MFQINKISKTLFLPIPFFDKYHLLTKKFAQYQELRNFLKKPPLVENNLRNMY